MKNIYGLLLVLTLMLGTISPGGAAVLPEGVPGGFDITDTGAINIIGAETILYTHTKTGARVMHIASEDKERAFVIAFETPAHDNKGIPHVFEHAVLGGSESYPSPALFFSVAYQTYNTAINATTYNAMTNYYYATMSEAQLLLITDYYLDSVFHPLLYRDKTTFLKEAWRYEVTDPEDPLNINGTVYNEMKGVRDLSWAAEHNMLNTLYPGSVAANDAGGIPEDILTMTYEDLIGYHQAYYHPSNALMFLYGDLDIGPFLSLIGKYCDRFDRKDIHIEKGLVERNEPSEAVFAFPMEMSSEVKDNAMIHYAYNLGKLPAA